LRKQTYIALLRGINVGGRNPVPMAALREACETLGWENVRTYIQSGNVLFSSNLPAVRLENDLEAAIVKRFGLTIAVVVRSAQQWESLADANPFVAAAESQPNLVMLGLSKAKPKRDAEAELQKRAGEGEAIAVRAGAIWIYFGNGAGRSKITPSVLDRAAGSPVTMRNWRTVLKIREMAGAK
jgi:uncharacterized protein (DUF1697 family)